MSVFQVTAVRTESSRAGTHEHVSHVGIGTERHVLPRVEAIRDLRNPHGDRYYTEAAGKKTDVIVIECPRCASSGYITTKPDWTAENSLLGLPRI